MHSKSQSKAIGWASLASRTNRTDRKGSTTS